MNEQKSLENVKLNDNFWKWFGNSKVVGSENPMVCYHGTNVKFNVFDYNEIGKANDYGYMGYGFYFMDDFEWGSGYAEYSAEKEGEKNILEVFLKIEKPYIIYNYNQLPLKAKTGVFNKEESKEITQLLKKRGYDGVILKGQPSEYLVFNPNQIKSIGNDGSWDINDNNIFS